jgi:hypothetical protein
LNTYIVRVNGWRPYTYHEISDAISLFIDAYKIGKSPVFVLGATTFSNPKFLYGYIKETGYSKGVAEKLLVELYNLNNNNKNMTEETKDAINPKHYQDIVPGMQYMEMMQYMLPRANLDQLGSHLLGQVYKYEMRLGKKDADIQELFKAKWYLDYLLAYMINGNKPIRVSDVKYILENYKK